MGSRKIYAVKSSDLVRLQKGKGKQKRKEVNPVSDSDSDYELAPCKKQKQKQNDTNELMNLMKTMHGDMKAVCTLSKGMKLPPGLYSQLVSTFKCQICHVSPINPPVMITRCCKNIIGCELCVDRWYGGEDGRTKTCPLCRSERAYSEINRLHGLDDFMKAIKPLVSVDDLPGPSSRSIPPAPVAEFDSDEDFEIA